MDRTARRGRHGTARYAMLVLPPWHTPPRATDSVAWLLANGADPHRQKDDSWRDTVLHYAAAGGSLDCVKILLAFGSDPRAKNFAGLMPRDYAASNNHLHVVEHLDMVMRALGDANGLTPTGINKIPTVPPNQLRASDVFYNAEASKQQPRRSSTSGGPIGMTGAVSVAHTSRNCSQRPPARQPCAASSAPSAVAAGRASAPPAPSAPAATSASGSSAFSRLCSGPST